MSDEDEFLTPSQRRAKLRLKAGEVALRLCKIFGGNFTYDVLINRLSTDTSEQAIRDRTALEAAIEAQDGSKRAQKERERLRRAK
ncbi:MAG: hypothetical protein WCP97_08050 [bacterium]